MNVNFKLSDWTYMEYNEFLSAFGKQDFRGAGHLIEKIVKDWSAFDNVPADAEHPFDHMALEDATALIHAIQANAKAYVDELDTSEDVTVDLSKWRWLEFNIFQEAISGGNTKKAVEMMLEVTRLKKGHPKSIDTLNAVQGMVLMQALSQKIQKVFSAKN